MSIRSIQISLLRSWRSTSRALDALTNPNLSAQQSIERFKSVAARWPTDHQAIAISIGGELRAKNIRVKAVREAA